MKLEIAKTEDSKALAEFYKSFPVRGLVEMKIDRDGNFFSPYEIQSDRHLTYTLKEEEKLEGVASFVMRDVLWITKCAPLLLDVTCESPQIAALFWIGQSTFYRSCKRCFRLLAASIYFLF